MLTKCFVGFLSARRAHNDAVTPCDGRRTSLWKIGNAEIGFSFSDDSNYAQSIQRPQISATTFRWRSDSESTSAEVLTSLQKPQVKLRQTSVLSPVDEHLWAFISTSSMSEN